MDSVAGRPAPPARRRAAPHARRAERARRHRAEPAVDVRERPARAAAVAARRARRRRSAPPCRTCSPTRRPTRAPRSRSSSSATSATRSTRTCGCPPCRPSRALPQDVLESIVGLHRELRRRATEAIATPEEARRANTELRLWLRDQDNHVRRLRAGGGAALRRRRPHRRRAHAPHGEPDGAAPRLLAHPRERPAALDALGDRPREHADLPAARLDPRRPRPARARAAGDGPPRARAPGAEGLRGVPAPAARDQLLRRRLPHAGGGERAVPPRGEAAAGTSRSRTSATRSA